MIRSRKEDEVERLIKRFFEVLERLTRKNPIESEFNDQNDIGSEIESMYFEFFETSRESLLELSQTELAQRYDTMQPNQMHALGILLYQDGLQHQKASFELQKSLFLRSKWFLEQSYSRTKQLPMQDLLILNTMDKVLHA